VASIVRDAIDRDILFFDEVNKEWSINYQDGTSKRLLSVSIADLSRKDEALILYLQSDNHLFSLLVSAMGVRPVEMAEAIDKEAVRSTDDMNVLRRYAKSLDIKSFGVQKELLRQDILNKLHEAATA